MSLRTLRGRVVGYLLVTAALACEAVVVVVTYQRNPKLTHPSTTER